MAGSLRTVSLLAFTLLSTGASGALAGLDEGTTPLALAAWSVGQALPASVAGAGAQPSAGASAPAKDRCAATGEMGGARFATTHCAVSLMQDQHSVAIWFNEDPLAPQEVDGFQTSSYADGTKGGKPRTMLIVMFCPGGGQGKASPDAVKSIDINTNHAKAPLEGIQWVVEAGKDFKVERMTGDVRPGGRLSGKLSGRRDRTTFNLDFDVTLPAKDAAAGMSCGK